MIIRNTSDLLSHGNIYGRKIALDVIECALRSIDSYEATKKFIQIKDNRELIVGDLRRDFSQVGKIYVVGGGKAAFPIARWLDEILGERIKEGVIVVKRGEHRRLKNIRVIEGGHPIPDEDGLEGAKQILKIAEKAKKGDIVFCIVTGGVSALVPLPARGITLDDKKRVNKLLLMCGSRIDEINTVRNHISDIKGGKLAKYIHPAEIINLIVIDEVAGVPWGPCVPDTTSFKDAIQVLKKYDLWRKSPKSVKEYLDNGLRDSKDETLKQKDFKNLKVQNVILANNGIICEAARKRSVELGFNSIIVSTTIEGESREVGVELANVARRIKDHSSLVKTPCTLIIGGETTVSILGQHGKGGPSQELALSFSLKIAGDENITLASIDTDGTDGPTEIAGGVTDGYTLERIKKKGLDLHSHLMKHNSSRVLCELGDAILTEPTETNVMDLNVIVIT